MADSTMSIAAEGRNSRSPECATNDLNDISLDDQRAQITGLPSDTAEDGNEHQSGGGNHEMNEEQETKEGKAGRKQEVEENLVNTNQEIYDNKEVSEEQVVVEAQGLHDVTEVVEDFEPVINESLPNGQQAITEPNNGEVEDFVMSKGTVERSDGQEYNDEYTSQLKDGPLAPLSPPPLEEQADAGVGVIDLTNMSPDSGQCLNDPAPRNPFFTHQAASMNHPMNQTSLDADTPPNSAGQHSFYGPTASDREVNQSQGEPYQGFWRWKLAEPEDQGRHIAQQARAAYEQRSPQQAISRHDAHQSQDLHSNLSQPSYTSDMFHWLQRGVRAAHPEWSAERVYFQAVDQYRRWAAGQQPAALMHAAYGGSATYGSQGHQQYLSSSANSSSLSKQDAVVHQGIQGVVPSSFMPTTNLNSNDQISGFHLGSQFPQPQSHSFYGRPSEQDFAAGICPVRNPASLESSSHDFSDAQALRYAQGYQSYKNKYAQTPNSTKNLDEHLREKYCFSCVTPSAGSRQALSSVPNKYGSRAHETKTSSNRAQPEQVDEHDCGDESEDKSLETRVGRRRSNTNDSVLGGPREETDYDSHYIASLRMSKAKSAASFQPRPATAKAHPQQTGNVQEARLAQAQSEHENHEDQGNEEEQVVHGLNVEQAAIDWKLPVFEAIYQPSNSKDAGVATVSVPGLVREEIMLSPDHEQQEVHLLLQVFLPFQQKLDTPDPEPAIAVLNFHTVALMVVEAFTQFEIGDEFGTGRGHWHEHHDQGDEDYERLRNAKDADTDEIFFDVMDRWRAALASGKEPCKLIRGVREFCDIALDVIDYIKENGLLGEKEQKAAVRSAKRAAPKVNELQSRKKAKTKISKGKGSAKKKGPTIRVIKKSKNQ